MKTWKIAMIGMGTRGQSLLTGAILPACADYGVTVGAICDVYEDRVAEGIKIVKENAGYEPKGVQDYQQVLDDPEIDGVILSCSWEAHIPLAIAAMKAGKYPALEVGGAYNIEECWDLIYTYEQTGTRCMLMENCCYGQWEMMAMNMVRQGVFGDIVHCSGGYHHDLRDQLAESVENRHYRLNNYLYRNCENYPTHELGPIAKVLDINNGNRIISLSSTASCAKGMHEYVNNRFGPDHHLSNAEFAQGDVVTTVLKCLKGQTITLTLDTTLPRTYTRGFTVRGTKGSYLGMTNTVFIDGVHNEYEWKGSEIWDNAKSYTDQYQHPLWVGYDPKGGHGGMDFLVFSAYMESLVNGTEPPIDVYDAATYMAITPLSEKSIAQGGAVIAVPDFTRGKWYMRKPAADSKFKLTR